MIATVEVKTRIAARREEFIHELFGDRAKRAGQDKWRIGKHGSLAVEIKDGELVYYSHEDGEGGDAIKLWQHERGGAAGDAIKACAAWAGVSGGGPVVTRPRRAATPAIMAPPSDAIPYMMDERELAEALTMVHRLYLDPDLCDTIAAARKWRPETIRALAQEASLGWHDGKLAFIYDSGVKLRWRCNGERVIRWHFGKPWIWRGAFLKRDSRKVYITEGETDAVRLIDAGIEADGSKLVVAMPSASTFEDEWRGCFAGKDVVLALDDDEAGRKATQKVAPILSRVAKSVGLLDWKGVHCAAA